MRRIQSIILLVIVFSITTLANEHNSADSVRSDDQGVQILETNKYLKMPTSFKVFEPRRTIYYWALSRYYVSETGKRHSYRQVNFISTIKSANCNTKYSASWRYELPRKFRQHVEGYYKGKLGIRPSHGESRGYWAYDSARGLASSRAGFVRNNQYVEYISDFIYYCK